jgi:hypothetical protein
MYSIGDWVDKLVIENIKIYNFREKILTQSQQLSDKEYVDTYLIMMKLIENRAMISNALDKKVNNVVSGKEDNIFLERIRTYNA